MPDNRSATHIDKDLGAILKNCRNKAAITQMVLAERCGLTFQQIQKYEKGKNRIAASTLITLCGAMGMRADAFLGEYYTNLYADAET